MFMQANKMKLRFPTLAGNVSVEDLWDLPLTSERGSSLNNTAKDINRELKEAEEENFVAERTSGNKLLQLKLDIVKAVIADKLADAEKARNALQLKEQKQKIMEIIASKQDAALEGKSLAALKKMLDNLGMDS